MLLPFHHQYILVSFDAIDFVIDYEYLFIL